MREEDATDAHSFQEEVEDDDRDGDHGSTLELIAGAGDTPRGDHTSAMLLLNQTLQKMMCGTIPLWSSQIFKVARRILEAVGTNSERSRGSFGRKF